MVDTAGECLPHLFLCIRSLILGRRRRILLFPFGNSNAPPNDTVSVYLDYADPKRAPEGWHACAQFALVISNPHDPTIYTVSRTCLGNLRDHSLICLTPLLDAHHRFIAEECDWGFTRFSELRKLFTIQEGHSRPTIEEECADVSVFVRVLEDPTGVLWHNFVKCGLWVHQPLSRLTLYANPL